MQRNRGKYAAHEGPFNDHINTGPAIDDHAKAMRTQLALFCQRLKRGKLIPRIPTPLNECTERADGHFHLACELFLQVSGWTRFHFPHEELLLQPGEIMVLPSKLLHAEAVGAGVDGRAFRSIVVYAEESILTCHLSYEVTPGSNSIEYLESREQTQGIQHWLNDAVKLHRNAFDRELSGQKRALLDMQISGLVTTAVAGILCALDDETHQNEEPPHVKLTRFHIQNQLGNHQVSVASLAGQVGCSADHLSRLFHQASGEHLLTHINRLRMERAAHLLRESELTAKEIAWNCGFISQSYFIKRFREHFNVTPKFWRGT